MKINNECARRVLIEVEKIPYGETLAVWKLQEMMSEFSMEEVINIVTVFNREHYLTVVDKLSYDDNDLFRDHKIKCLTEKGYRILDLIRDDEVWKEITSKVENVSIYTLFDIANRVNVVRQNRMFDLPETLASFNTRW